MAEHNAPLTQERLEWRRSLCDNVVTLNGERAYVSGIRNRFATVTQAKSGLSAEWSWETVERVVTNQFGAFKS